MHIAFIHTPMPLLEIDGRYNFWHNFDMRYYAVHPASKLMKESIWELPQWMIWLGGVLFQEGFSSMEVIDLYSQCSVLGGIDEDKVYAILREHPADVFLFSPLTPNLPYSVRIANILKILYPKCIVIFGGIAATPLHQELAQDQSIDYVIAGKGEYALPELLLAIEGQSDISNVGNLTYFSQDKQVVTNSFIYPEMPLCEIPFPKVDLFPETTGESIRYIRQVYALGCPYRCAYCSAPDIGRRPRYFPISRVISEIRACKSYYGNHHHIYFGDLTFTSNVRRTLELCDALWSEGDIIYDAQTRLDCLQDPCLPRALYRSGCRWLEIGIETMNQGSLDLFSKHLNVTKIEDTLKRLRDHGIPTCSYMVVGFPNETIDNMKRSIERICSFIERGLLHASYLFNLVPYPGSMMFNYPQQYGMTLLHHNYALYREDLMPVYKSDNFTPEQAYQVLLAGIRDLGQVMLPKAYLGESVDFGVEKAYGDFWRGAHP